MTESYKQVQENWGILTNTTENNAAVRCFTLEAKFVSNFNPTDLQFNYGA